MKLIHDLRLAWRGLGKSPELATIVIGTLALGIGASTAIFSVVDGVLLEPLNFAEPERRVRTSVRRNASWISSPSTSARSRQTTLTSTSSCTSRRCSTIWCATPARCC